MHGNKKFVGLLKLIRKSDIIEFSSEPRFDRRNERRERLKKVG